MAMSKRNNLIRKIRYGLIPAAVTAALLLGSGTPAGAAQVSVNWWPAIANDRADDMRQMLAQGADPNLRYQNGQPAIMRAVIDQAWRVFDVLAADPHTDINAENPAGETPLMYLALTGQTERAQKLIARGAQVNRLGWTPLHYAASKGQVDAAKLLLRNHAMPNAPSPRGATPLMMAGLSGSQAMVQLLIGAGADVSTRDLQGKDAADWADDGKHSRLADALRTVIARADQRKQDMRGASGRGEAPAMAAGQPAEAPPILPAVPQAGAAAGPASTGQDPAPPAPRQEDAPAVQGVTGLRQQTY